MATYFADVVKIAMVALILIATVMLTVQAVGIETIQAAIDFVGVDVVVSQTMMLTGVVFFASLLFIAVIFEVLLLSGHKWDVYRSKMVYSPGKRDKHEALSLANITSVNFKTYAFRKMGEVTLWVSGTDFPALKMKNVPHAQEVSNRINGILFDFRNGAGAPRPQQTLQQVSQQFQQPQQVWWPQQPQSQQQPQRYPQQPQQQSPEQGFQQIPK